MKIKGMDVSNYQGKISVNNFKRAKAAGIKFVILKLGYTGYAKYQCKIDDAFENNYRNAKAAGLLVGVYYYSLANGPITAKEEADYTIKILGNRQLDYPVYLDVEDPKYRQSKASKKNLADACDSWCKTIAAAGYTPGIYASLNWFNNKIGKIAAPHTKWVAQYNKTCDYKGDYDMWQYSSSESVPGIASRTDVNWSYKEFEKVVKTPELSKEPTLELPEEGAPVADAQTSMETAPTGEQAPAPTTDNFETYQGKFPTLKINKTTQQVIDDTVAWAVMIAKDNRFHYGYTNKSKTINAHHNGCYFCGTQGSNKKGIVDKEFSYCCNPFIHAAWSHGGQVPSMLKICKKGSSYGFLPSEGYAKSDLFKHIKRPALKELKKGDVMCKSNHVAMYAGNGKIVESSGGDDNKRNSEKWNHSIRVKTLTKDRYDDFPRVYRFIGNAKANHNVTYGDISDDVGYLQGFLNWYGDYGLAVDRKFMDLTLKALKDYQRNKGLKPDGVCGPATLEAMKAEKKEVK